MSFQSQGNPFINCKYIFPVFPYSQNNYPTNQYYQIPPLAGTQYMFYPNNPYIIVNQNQTNPPPLQSSQYYLQNQPLQNKIQYQNELFPHYQNNQCWEIGTQQNLTVKQEDNLNLAVVNKENEMFEIIEEHKESDQIKAIPRENSLFSPSKLAPSSKLEQKMGAVKNQENSGINNSKPFEFQSVNLDNHKCEKDEQKAGLPTTVVEKQKRRYKRKNYAVIKQGPTYQQKNTITAVKKKRKLNSKPMFEPLDKEDCVLNFRMTESKIDIKESEYSNTKKSRFHNLTKLFLNSVLGLFTRENLGKINISQQHREELLMIIQKVRQSGKQTKEKICKTDLYNHSHYNALFLVLNKKNLAQLKLKKKDVDLHKFCFNLDLTQPISVDEQLKINQIKKSIYKITKRFIGNPPVDDSQGEMCVRDEYWQRAMKGLKSLTQGKIILRFQQK